MRTGRNNSFFNLVALCAQVGWNQDLPPPSCETKLEHPQTWLGNSLALFGARKSERSCLTPGEDSHKGPKSTQPHSVVGSLPLPRKLLKEEFGGFLHLPRISSHLAVLPLLGLQAGCGHIHVYISILCGTGSGSPTPD